MGIRNPDDVRISPEVIAAAVPRENDARVLWARARAGLLAAAPVAVVAFVLVQTTGSSWWFVPVWPVALAVAAYADGVVLLHREAERSARNGRVAGSLFARALGSARDVRAEDLRPGDWAASKAEYAEKTRPIRRRNSDNEADHLRRKAQREEREREANLKFTMDLAEWTANPEGPRPTRPRVPGVPKPYRHPLPPPEFAPVLVRDLSGDERTSGVWLAGRSLARAGAADHFLCVGGGAPVRVEKEDATLAEAVSTLMAALSSSWVQESALVASMIEAGHPPRSARHAVRACVAVGLAVPDPERRRTLLEGLPRLRARLGVEARDHRLKLSGLGAAWTRSVSPPTVREPAEPAPPAISQQFHIYNPTLAPYSSIGGVGDIVHNERDPEITALVKAVVQFLEAQRDRFPETSDPAGLEAALKDLRGALAEPDMPVSRVRKTLGVVYQVGVDLAVGVGGNFLFEGIKKVIGM
ncbi:hypothetical protein [Planotetraspora phitsanulokensis]|uniref:Uncharacterized protein n=1 Tax=Planotetraspora phitsanulokensis TaxID=575192 RepID=A0A8J3UGT1_9ACTN|nr:hypothetical protein [Planotetraspora phitsanulokensis]GII42014.1 hypothetical protein Pph01_70170 [Planotetraspora phitsanulokensis]